MADVTAVLLPGMARHSKATAGAVPAGAFTIAHGLNPQILEAGENGANFILQGGNAFTVLSMNTARTELNCNNAGAPFAYSANSPLAIWYPTAAER